MSLSGRRWGPGAARRAHRATNARACAAGSCARARSARVAAAGSSPAPDHIARHAAASRATLQHRAACESIARLSRARTRWSRRSADSRSAPSGCAPPASSSRTYPQDHCARPKARGARAAFHSSWRVREAVLAPQSVTTAGKEDGALRRADRAGDGARYSEHRRGILSIGLCGLLQDRKGSDRPLHP